MSEKLELVALVSREVRRSVGKQRDDEGRMGEGERGGRGLKTTIGTEVDIAEVGGVVNSVWRVRDGVWNGVWGK